MTRRIPQRAVTVIVVLTMLTAGFAGAFATDGQSVVSSSSNSLSNESATPTPTPTEEPTSDDNDDGGSQDRKAKSHHKIESGLLADESDSFGTATTDSDSDSSDVRVVIEGAPGQSDTIGNLVGQAGGSVEVQHGHLTQATVPRSALESLADNPAVDFVRAPREPATESITSEGLANMNVSGVHDEGYTGDGVTVAVIDVDFDLEEPEIADNVVAQKDFTGEGFTNTSGLHGTATTELVVDTAPNVSIIAVKIGTDVELYEAIDWLETYTDTDVVTMSLSWYNVGPLDGTALMNQHIDTSIQNGTAWFTSAGNDGYKSHWNGTWNDPDGNGFMNFAEDDELLNLTPTDYDSGWEPVIWLSWDDWDDRYEDYDLYLYNDTSNFPDKPVAWSTGTQSGTQSPTEEFNGQVDEPLYLAIHNYDANGTADFDLFFRRADPEYWTASRSVTIPGTGKHIIAVGATDADDDGLEYFSSRGPTIDGRLKPDIVAPDNVSTNSYGTFSGTSAASPHAAGVAALLIESNGSLYHDEVKETLTTTAATVQGDEPNNRTGYGLVDAYVAVESVEEETVLVNGTILLADGTPAAGDWIEATGQGDGRPTGTWTNDTGAFSIEVPVNDTYTLAYFQGNETTDDEHVPLLDGSPDVHGFANVTVTDSGVDLGTYQLPDAHRLNVTVVDERGDPVEGATGTIAHENGSLTPEFGTDPQAETDANGNLSSTGADHAGFEVNGTVTVQVNPPVDSGFEERTYEETVTVDSEEGITITLNASETVEVSGAVREPDDTAATDDRVVLMNEDEGEAAAWLTTDANGAFGSEVDANTTIDLQYYQDRPFAGDPPSGNDGVPDMFALAQVNAVRNADVGTITLPEAYPVNVTVVNRTDVPVENATVLVDHHNDSNDADAGVLFWTDEDGRYYLKDDVPGMELVGNVTIEVWPPEDELYKNETYVRNLTVTSAENVTFTLNESDRYPPRIDSFEPADGTLVGDSSVNASATYSDSSHVDDSGVNASAVKLVVDGTAVDLNFVNATELETTVSGLSDGEHTIELVVVDNESNTATETRTIEVDTTPPNLDAEFTVPELVTVRDPIEMSFSTHDDHDGLDSSNHEVTTWLIVTNATDETEVYNETLFEDVASVLNWDVQWNGTDHAGNVVPYGEYNVTLRSQDTAGNVVEDTRTVSVDNTPPTVDLAAIDAGETASTPPTGQTVYTNGTLSVDATADGTPGDAANVTVDLLATFANFRHSIETTNDGTNWTNTTALDFDAVPDDGTYDANLTALDEAGNANETTADVTIVLDREAPELSATVSQLNATNGSVNVTSSEPLADDPTIWVERPDGTLQDVTIVDNGTTWWNATFELADENGQYDVTATGTDRAGNVGQGTATTNISTVETENNTVTVVVEPSGVFVNFTTNQSVSDSLVVTQSNTPLAPLAKGSAGVNFLDAQLGEYLDSNLSYAIVAIPVDMDAVPASVEKDEVTIRYYNESTGDWEFVETNVTTVDLPNGDEGEYWVANVTHFSTYGAVAEDDDAPKLEDSNPSGDLSSDTTTQTIEFDYSDDVSGVNTSAVTLQFNGSDVTSDAATTITSEYARYDATGLSPGDYTAEVYVEDEAGNGDTYTLSFTVPEADDGDDGSSGGGGGGGGSPPAPGILTEVTRLSDGSVEMTIQNGYAERTAQQYFDDGIEAGDATFDRLRVTYAYDLVEFAFEMHPSADAPADVPAIDGVETLGFLTVEKDVQDGYFESVEFRFDVPRSALPDGASRDDVTLYRYDGSGWSALETEREGGKFVATAPGFSTFAVGVDAGEPDLAVTNADLSATDLAAGEEVEVSAVVENEGRQAGSMEVALEIDGETVASETVEVEAGASETVSFGHAFEEAGTYEIVAGGEVAGTVTVTTDDGGDESITTDEEVLTPTTDPDDGQPGFGLVVALVAVLGVGYWVRRQS